MMFLAAVSAGLALYGLAELVAADIRRWLRGGR